MMNNIKHNTTTSNSFATFSKWNDNVVYSHNSKNLKRLERKKVL